MAPTPYEETLKQPLGGELTGQVQYRLTTFNGEEKWGTETDLDENAYGAAAVAIVKDVSKLCQQITDKVPFRGKALTLARLGFSLGIMMLNLIFQGLVLWYIY